MKLNELQIKQHSDYPNEFNVYLGQEYIGDIRYTVVLGRFIFESIYPVLFGNTKTFVSIDEFKHRFESDTPNHLESITNQIDKFVENYKEVNIPYCIWNGEFERNCVLESSDSEIKGRWMAKNVKLIKYKDYIEFKAESLYLIDNNMSYIFGYLEEVNILNIPKDVEYDKSKIYTKQIDMLLNKITFGFHKIPEYINSDTECKWNFNSNKTVKLKHLILNNQQF